MADVSGPQIAIDARHDSLELTATVHLRECLELRGQVRCGLTCVIEDEDKISYWALKHPTDTPDFHRVEGFVLDQPRLSLLCRTNSEHTQETL